MIDPTGTREKREAAIREGSGGQSSSEAARRDLLMPTMTSINIRIRAYEDKIKEWQDVGRKINAMPLSQEKLNRINECESQLQHILLEYNTLRNQLQQETRVDAAQLLAGNSLLQLNQQDIDYLESGCGNFLAELKTTSTPAAAAVPDPQIKSAFDRADYDQVINLYAQSALTPGQNPAFETTLQYGQALLKNHQEAEARRVFADLLAKTRQPQPPADQLLQMMQLLGDLNFVMESYDEARRQYEEVVRVSIEKGAHKEEWSGLQLAALQPGAAAAGEMKDYGILLKNYLAYTPKRDGYAVTELADRFLQSYPASRFNANVNVMRADSRAQAEGWVNQGIKRIEATAGERRPLDAQVSSGQTPVAAAQGVIPVTAGGGQTGVVPATAAVDEKALQEDYDKGAAHLQAKEYDKAVERLNRLQRTPYEAKARPLIEEAAKLGAQDARQKAAELFVRASSSRDSEEKRKLLLASRDLLQGILVKYPQSGLTDKVQRNLTRIEAELKAVDAGGAAPTPKPAASGGAYVPPKAGAAPVAPATSM
jgi:outer membrane protein assembly factor BamD (BamD/ComL family)